MLVTLLDFFPTTPGAAYRIQTPGLGDGYAAQLWGARGYWLVGRGYPTIPAARAAAQEFAATGPTEPAPGTPRGQLPANWVRARSDSHTPKFKFVRRVKGGAWQARPWLGKEGGSLNLGLFTLGEHDENAEWAAAQVASAFVREWTPGRTVAEVVERLKNAKRESERVPPHVTVPERQRHLTPPTDYGPAMTVEEMREDRREKLLTLGDFFRAA